MGKLVRLRQISREQERDDCRQYYACLTEAARKEAPWIPCLNCARYERDESLVKDKLAEVIEMGLAGKKKGKT